MSSDSQRKTAFVFAGGGSFGAIQVGMLHSLATHGIVADMVFGSSVGAINAAYYAGTPTLEGIRKLETIWRGLRRQDVFPISLRTLLGFIRRRDFRWVSGWRCHTGLPIDAPNGTRGPQRRRRRG